MTSFNDQEHIAKILSGDSKSFEILVNQYKNMVFSLALQMVKNKEEAEEVAQDSFIKVFKSLNKFKGDSKFSTWLYRITYNTCLDRIKKYKKSNQTYYINEITINQISSVDSALENLELQERNEIIKNCMQQLAEKDRFLLTLYYFDELSLEEISKVIHKNYNQVRINLYRCRKKLASILKKNLEPDIIENYGRKAR
jgi:RNA polymerase sigma-70 factor (ECF subfamily)